MPEFVSQLCRPNTLLKPATLLRTHSATHSPEPRNAEEGEGGSADGWMGEASLNKLSEEVVHEDDPDLIDMVSESMSCEIRNER